MVQGVVWVQRGGSGGGSAECLCSSVALFQVGRAEQRRR